MGLSLLGACISEVESASEVELSDSAGVRTVFSRHPQWGERAGWTVVPEPLAIIGLLNGPEEDQLVDVSSAARREDGKLVVADRRTRSVRLFDAEGSFLRTLGGPGSGPGEFQHPERVLVTSEDSVLVWDAQLFRMTRYDQSGALASVRTLDMGELAKAVDPPLYPGRIDPIPGGDLLVRLLKKEGKTGPLPGVTRRGSGALRVAEDLSTIDTLAFFDGLEQVTVDAPWGPFSVEPPLARRTELAHSPGRLGTCVGVQEEPQIDCYREEGGESDSGGRMRLPP